MSEPAAALVSVMTESRNGNRRVYTLSFIFHSDSVISVHTTENDYEITFSEKGARCSCPAAKRNIRCRHLLLLEVVRRVHRQERALR